MTGLYTPRHGVYTVSPSARGDKTKRKLIPITNTEDVRTDFVTLGEALKQQGYVCGLVHLTLIFTLIVESKSAIWDWMRGVREST